MSPKPTTLDLLNAHAPIEVVLKQAIRAIRADPQLDLALDRAGANPEDENVQVRFLAKRVAYAVTLIFDAEPWRKTPAGPSGKTRERIRGARPGGQPDKPQA